MMHSISDVKKITEEEQKLEQEMNSRMPNVFGHKYSIIEWSSHGHIYLKE